MKKIVMFFVVVVSLQLFSIRPSKKYNLTPDSLELRYQDNMIKVNDSIFLHSWLIHPLVKNKLNQKLILIANSDAGNMGDLLYYAQILADKGYTVVLFDYRGFGTSSAFQHQQHFLYHLEYIEDLKAVFSFYKKQFSDINAYGLSMGSIIISKSELKFDKIIYESPPQNISVFLKKLKNKKGKDLQFPHEEHPIVVDPNTNLKTLVLCGTFDELCSCKDFKKGKNLQIVTYRGDHLQALYKMSTDRSHIADIFTKVVHEFFSDVKKK